MRSRIAFLIFLAAAAPLWAATPAEYQLKIERQPLSAALQEFAKQSGVQIIFFSTVTDGRQAPALNGKFTAAAALGRLLDGSELTFRELNSKTIEVQPRNGRAATDSAASGAGQPLLLNPSPDPSSSMRAIHLAQVDPAPQGATTAPRDRAAADAQDTTAGEKKPEEVVVTGSRIRGLAGEATIQPVLTLTQEDIERTGATSLGEVLRYVPQISSHTEGLFMQSAFAFGASSGSSTDTRVTASLRGAPAGGTLLLINGRRAPRNGQEQAGSDGYDLSGIPLAAVERIEVLLDGASAIYGADAVGGVINVILKRDYRGMDVNVTYGNTFDSDVHVFTGNLIYGFGFGKLSGILTLSHEESGNLMWADRDFLRTQDRRPWGGTNATSFQIPSANGTISIPAGNTAGLPAGLRTIPVGATGTNKTAADYLAAGGAPPGTDLGIWAAYNSPYTRQAALATFEYAFNSNVTAFGELRASTAESVVTATPVAVSSISLPADAPGNIFGAPVTMRRFLSDLPAYDRSAESRNRSATVGLRANLGHDWRVETSLGPTYSRPQYVDPLGFSISQDLVDAALANPNPALRPNFFYDATTPGLNPNPPGLIESLAYPDRSLERDETWVYQVTADGPLVNLWAGELRAAVGAEYREEQVEFPLQTEDDLFGARARDRYATGVFAELRLPLLSDKQHIPLVNRLEVMAAIRRDMYARDEFGDATKPRYGVMYKPVSWLAARASYGEGYKVPTLNQLYAPAYESTIFFSTINPARDPYRGNEALPATLPILSGGNPNLTPEETESTTAGVVIDVPGELFRGLSFSLDYFDQKYLNRISASLSFVDRLTIFPELFERGANLPGDQPGWPGPIIGYDNRAVNVSLNRITGWDGGLKYLRPFPWGELLLTYNASQVYRNENRPRPGAPPASNAVRQGLPLQMSGGVSLKKSALELGVLMSYRDLFKRSLTERPTPSAIRWDWRTSYDFADSDVAPSGGWWGWLANTQVSVTIFNIFDTPPPMSGATGLPESSLLDALGRRYSLSFKTSFGANGR